MGLQLAAAGALTVAAWAAGRIIQSAVLKRYPDATLVDTPLHRLRDGALHLAPQTISAALLWVAIAVFREFELGVSLLRVFAIAVTAWVIVRFLSRLVANPNLSRAIAWTGTILAVMVFFDILEPTIGFLDAQALPIGGDSISLLDVMSGLGLAAAIAWAANVLSRLVGGQLARSARLPVSVQGVVAQMVQLALFAIAVVVGLSAIGVNLTALALFSGALGIGIGFGLQNVFASFIAGIVILTERSLRVGDFVQIDEEVRGEVREINLRSTLIRTNDNVDIIVPNYDFMSFRVRNWTLREAFRRIHVPFGVAYGTDKDKVREAVIAAAETVQHTLVNVAGREPDVWLVGFGDSSLNFELIVWLKPDAVKRPDKVQADYMWAIETALREAGIQIPFPQRDIHIKSQA